MKKGRSFPPPKKSRYTENSAQSFYFFKIIIKWLGIAVLLLIVGFIAYLLIR